MNPLFTLLNNANNPAMQILQRFNEFRRNYSGNPQQHIQQLMQSGRITQAQYNQAVQMAQQLQNMIK